MDPRIEDILRKPYSRVVIPDECGLYSAAIAEFPGCVTDGESPAGAYRSLEEVAASWLESVLAQGFPIPEPFNRQF